MFVRSIQKLVSILSALNTLCGYDTPPVFYKLKIFNN